MNDMEHRRLVDMYLTMAWTTTRGFVIDRMQRAAGPLLELMCQVEESDEDQNIRIDGEIDAMITVAIGRPPECMTRRQLALWDAVRHAWPDRSELARMLKQNDSLRGRSTACRERAFAAVLANHLDARRVEAARKRGPRLSEAA